AYLPAHLVDRIDKSIVILNDETTISYMYTLSAVLAENVYLRSPPQKLSPTPEATATRHGPDGVAQKKSRTGRGCLKKLVHGDGRGEEAEVTGRGPQGPQTRMNYIGI
ncbi:unnamed protein product, partial [Didymodactylos carnosus]